MKRFFAVGLVSALVVGTWISGGAKQISAALCAVTGSSDTLSPSDFSYVGSFKLDNRPAGSDYRNDPGLGSSIGSIAVRSDSGDGLTILITGWQNSTRVFEYRVPDVSSITRNLNTTASASLLRTYGDVMNGLTCRDLFAPQLCPAEFPFIMGISYVGDAYGNGKELLVHYRAAYYANAWDPSVVSVILNTDQGSGGYASSTTKGPWCDSQVPVGGRDAYSFPVTPGLSALMPSISGKLLMGGDAYQVGPGYGMGPNLVAVSHPGPNARDVTVDRGQTPSCSMRNSVTLINHDAAHPASRNDNAYLGIDCQSCGCVDSHGNSVDCSSVAAIRTAGSAPYRGSRFFPTWNSLNPDGSGTQPENGTNFMVMDRTLSAVAIETPGGKSAVLFAAQLADTLPGYPYPNPLGLSNPMSELYYGQRFTKSGSWGTDWEATGFGVTTLVAHLIAYSESDLARVVGGQVPAHGLTPAWDVRKSQLGGYGPVGSNRRITGPGVDVSLDDFPDLMWSRYQMKMAYDPASKLLFISRPNSWAYSPYDLVPTIDVWRVTAQ